MKDSKDEGAAGAARSPDGAFWRERYNAAIKLSYQLEAELNEARRAVRSLIENVFNYHDCGVTWCNHRREAEAAGRAVMAKEQQPAAPSLAALVEQQEGQQGAAAQAVGLREEACACGTVPDLSAKIASHTTLDGVMHTTSGCAPGRPPARPPAPAAAALATSREGLRIQELEGALREDIAWINGMMCPECGVEMTPEHDEEAGGEDGYANEDCCKDAREHRSRLLAVLGSAATEAQPPPDPLDRAAQEQQGSKNES